MGWTQRCFFHVGVKEIRAFEVCQALAEGKTLVLMRPSGFGEKSTGNKRKTAVKEIEWAALKRHLSVLCDDTYEM